MAFTAFGILFFSFIFQNLLHFSHLRSTIYLSIDERWCQDVTALNNIALSQISPSTSPSDISVAILGKQLDVTQKLGDTMIQAMERSVNPHIGGNIDISV